jgi:hypothetical protein
LLSEAKNWNKKTNSVLAIIKTSALDYYQNTILKSRKVHPHIALLIAFHNIFQEARNSINDITLKHQDYYLKNILQIPLKNKQPDSVHVNFISNNEKQVEVLKGQNLIAGKDDEGNDIIYKIDKTILINDSLISDAIGFEFEKSNSGKNFFLKGSEFEKRLINFNENTDQIGFSFGSNFLFLDEGVRKISFKLDFTTASVKEFSKLFKEQNNSQELNLFEVSYTCEEGWFKVSGQRTDTIFHVSENEKVNPTLEIIVLIDNIDPSIIPLDIENIDFKDHSAYPMFQFIFKDNHLPTYHALKLLEIVNINIDVEILEVKNLNVSNDFGDIDTTAPFEPFGSQPLINSSFIIGHPTYFLYPINDFKINLEWYGLPLLEGGFSNYYSGYPWEVDNEIFEAKISYLRNKRWVPEEERQVVSLFQDIPDETGAVSNIRRINEINIRDLDLHLPALSKKNIEPFSTKSKDGFLKFELCYPLEGFGHQQYPEILRESTMKSLKKKADVSPPNEPYTPTLKSISADFKMSMNYNQENVNDFDFYHIHPVGIQKVTEINSILPNYNNGSSFCIGLNNINVNKQFSILFQINEGFANKSTEDLNLKWFYYDGSKWQTMNEDQLIKDNTNGFKHSGIVELNLEKTAFDKSGLFSSDSIWFKVESLSQVSFLPFVQDVLIHATTATCYNYDYVSYANLLPNQINSFDKNREDIEFIGQKYHGFNGVEKEVNKGYFLRVAERLRHKNRAVSCKDFEKILLEKFPKINRVKCLANIDSAFNLSPGNVLIVVVPKIIEDKNFIGIPRYFSTIEISQMDNYLKTIVPVGLKFKITNPNYEQVKIKFSLKIKDGFDKNFYVQKLNEGIKAFISPWMYSLKHQVELGQTISSALILNYIDKQEYVEHIVNFSLFHLVDGRIINQKTAKSNSVEVKPTSLISILTTDTQHIILPYDEKEETDNFGINEMMIDTDYIVDYSNKEELEEESSLKIEKSYKIMPAKEDNKPLSSNFTFYITV